MWTARLVGLIIGLLFRGCRWLLRIVTLGEHNLREGERLGGGHLPVFALLHAHQMSLIAYNAFPCLGVITSRSKDGEIAATVLRTFGIVPIRGSSSNRGKDALKAAVSHVAGGNPLGLTVDGPRGPRGTCKRGICDIARRTGRPVVPLVAVPLWRKEIRSWDRFQIPLPLSRLVVIYGEPIVVEPDADDEHIYRCCERIATRLSMLEQQADAWRSSGDVP